jgi:hypothetical protein
MIGSNKKGKINRSSLSCVKVPITRTCALRSVARYILAVNLVNGLTSLFKATALVMSKAEFEATANS